MTRLNDLYNKEIKKELAKEFKFKNAMQIPYLKKIVINFGVGEAVGDSKTIQFAVNELELISGQKPVITKAKNSIATFKLREGMPIGVKVTLRKARMYEFLDRLVNIAMPRIKDFRGISAKSFDGNGNYSMGIKEQIIFPEIDYDKIDQIRGMDITFVTSTSSDVEAKALLQKFNMPFPK